MTPRPGMLLFDPLDGEVVLVVDVLTGAKGETAFECLIVRVSSFNVIAEVDGVGCLAPRSTAEGNWEEM